MSDPFFNSSRYVLATCIFLVLLSSCKISNTSKYYVKAKENHAPFDAIIVPGYPYEDSTWNRVIKLRLYWVKYLWENGMTKNIIFSGGAVYTKYTESAIMKLFAIEMGIPEENIFIEERAEHSTENVFYSYYIAKDLNFKKLAVASDPYQSKNLKLFVNKVNRKLGVNIQMLPTMMDTILSAPLPEISIDPSSAIGSHFVDIENSQSNWFRLKGTLGLHINWQELP